MVSALEVAQQYRGMANGWNSAIGTVGEIEHNDHDHAIRVRMLREGGAAEGWFSIQNCDSFTKMLSIGVKSA